MTARDLDRRRAIHRHERRHAARRLGFTLARLWRHGRRALAVWQERRLLAQLDDRALRDIGLSRGDAYRESSRPWWDLPPERFDARR